jgi:hypothetical protein
MANILAIDFDGVIMSKLKFSAKFMGQNLKPVIGKPLPGAVDGVKALAQEWQIVVFSARAGSVLGKAQIENWLERYGLTDSVVDVTDRKPIATAYIDDRAFRFESWPEVLAEFGPVTSMRGAS